MGEQSNGQEGWDVLTPNDKMLPCVEGLHCICTFSCSGQRVGKRKAGENRKREEKGKLEGEKGRSEEIKPRSSGKFFEVCSLKGCQDFR